MKVKDLLSKLSDFDPEHEILCYSEDEGLVPDEHMFRIFEINSVDVAEAEKTRGDDGIPSLNLGKTQYSKPHVLIDITANS